jgi:hypothetical protein
MGTTLLLRIFGALRPSQRAMSFRGRRSAGTALRGAAACALTASVLLAACSDDGLTSPASFENVTRRFSVYALSGTSAALPAAYQFTTESLIRPQVLPSGSINFDVAFDIGADGRVLILPVRLVVPSPPNPAPPVGVLRVSQSFEQVGRAPDRGFQVDSAAVAGVGETVVFELFQSGCIYGESFYAKLTVDSIIPGERRIVVRSLVNRNCGFRGLAEGLPTN